MAGGSDEQYRFLIESMQHLAVYMVDADGRIASWNRGAEHLYGYSALEIVGRSTTVFHAGEDLVPVLPANAQVTDHDRSHEFEGWRLRKDGSKFWASVVTNLVRNASGVLLGSSHITRDISDRKIAVEAQRVSEAQFRRLIHGVIDYAIYMLDIKGYVQTWNAGAERIKGYQAEEIVAQHFSVFYTEPDRLAGEPDRSLAIALENGRFEKEALRLRKDGTPFWAHVIIDRIDDKDGTPIGFAKITRDVTKRRQTEEELEVTRKALHQAQKMEAIGQLTGGVAHDFNNLLQVISGNLQLLQEDLAGHERGMRRVQNAMAGVTRGAKLASQLLSFGRRQPLEPRVVNPGRLVRDMDEMLRRTLGEGVEIETVISGGLWNAFIDPFNLENALLNLAINARDAMNGQGRLTIEAGNAFLDHDYARQHADLKAGQYVLIAVTDTGNGMPVDILEKVFDPFFSTKPEGSGTGLGLSMVYGFAKQSGGHIKIYSEVGHGTTVRLYLPRTLETEVVSKPILAAGSHGGSEAILVVEDDDAVRETAVSMLQALGYHVVQAHDAESALAVVDTGIPLDLLFTDVIMPGVLRSPDLARKVKARLPGIAVLFTSGYTENAIVHGGRLDAGVDLLTKPYASETLAAKVRAVLDTQRKRNDAAGVQPPGEGDEGRQQGTSAEVPALPTILFCEDDAQIRAAVKDMLESKGYPVVEAASATDALRLWTIHQPTLLITDLALPDMSGIDLARHLRLQTPHAPVIFATGLADDHPTPEGGPTATIVKPYGVEILINTILRLTVSP